MKNRLWPLLAVTVLFTLPALAATSKPETPYHLTTVSWIVTNQDNIDVDDRYVTLIGRVSQKIKDGAYWFTDGTANIRLDSNDQALPVGSKIVLGGRIDQAYFGLGHLEVEVKQWHYAKKP